MEEHPFRTLMRIAEGEELSLQNDHGLSPAYEEILQRLSEGPQTAEALGVSPRMLIALANAGFVVFEGGSPRSATATRWSIAQSVEEPITEEEMMSRDAVAPAKKTSTDGSDSPLSTKRRRGLTPKAAKALFSK